MSDNDERMELSEAEDAALRSAARAWTDEGRAKVSASRRLAMIRAAQAVPQVLQGPGSTTVSRWPGAAVAMFVVGMLGFALLWSQSQNTPRKIAVAEGDAENEKPQPPVDEALASNDSEETTEWRVAVKKDAAVHVENLSGEIRIMEIASDKVVIRAHKKPRARNDVSMNGNVLLVGNRDSAIQGREISPLASPQDVPPEKPTIIDINGSNVPTEILAQAELGEHFEKVDPKGEKSEKLRRKPTTSDEAKEAFKRVAISVAETADGDVRIRSIQKQPVSIVQVYYEIGIPRHARIGVIKQTSGDVQIRGGQGNANIETMSGFVSIRDTRGTVTAKTTNGGIDIAGTGGVGGAETMSGSVKIAKVPSVAQVHTTNGDVDVEAVGNLGPVATMSGDVVVKDCGGAIDIHTTNGKISVTGAAAIKRMETMSGDINADIGSLSGKTASISATNGGVHMRLAATLSAKVHAQCTSGTIESTVRGLKVAKKRTFDIGTNLDGVVGEGAGTLSISTMSGDITLTPLETAKR